MSELRRQGACRHEHNGRSRKVSIFGNPISIRKNAVMPHRISTQATSPTGSLFTAKSTARCVSLQERSVTLPAEPQTAQRCMLKSTLKLFAIAVLCTGVAVPASFAAAPIAFAQDHDHHDDHPADNHDNHGGYVRHDEYKKGYRMPQADWARGQRIDYRTYHLNAPPRGYEWRSVDGNYVLGAVATGVIASAIVASTIH
jgi:Ni/Co efflux regulator RcnB